MKAKEWYVAKNIGGRWCLCQEEPVRCIIGDAHYPRKQDLERIAEAMNIVTALRRKVRHG